MLGESPVDVRNIRSDDVPATMRTTRHFLACLGLLVAGSASAQPHDLVVAGGRVMDPESGLDAVRHIGITAGTVQAVSETPLEGRETIDATGLVVAPGFIDVNISSQNWQANEARVLDGVTTALVMESAPGDVEQWYDERRSGAVINYGAAVGHWQVRLAVMGDTGLEGEEQWREMEHSKANPDQLAAILRGIDEGLRQGGLGVGMGLEYIPATTHAEALEVFRLAAAQGAPVHIHMRGWGYDDKHIRSYGDLYEIFGGVIASGADIHIKHINSSYADWTPIGLELISKARSQGLPVTTEMYPYAFGSCVVGAAFFDDWETYPSEYFATKLRLASTGEWLTRETFRALREGNEEARLLCYDNTEEMVRIALQSPMTMIASDGGSTLHPRIAGTYSRVLGHYVREEGLLTLMEALRKMTIMPALHMESRAQSMRRKGRIQVGADADLVIFDPDLIIDRSTVLEPLKQSVGMRAVLIHGVPVVRDGALQQGVFPGQPIRGPITD